jgi:ABC-type phosphate transport system substrate-binding protein
MWLLLMAAALVPSAESQISDIAVIVNPNNATANVTLADLRKIFAGQKRTWPGGVPIKLLVRGTGCRERLTLLRLLGMSESEYKQYWTAQVFRGEADAEPLALPSFGMVKEATMAFPGAIGLADAKDIKAGMIMKVLKVDGRMPGEPGYPLH